MTIAQRLAAFATALVIAAGAAGCAYLDVKQREWIFRPAKEVARSPAEYGLTFEDVWLQVQGADDTSERVHGWWIPATDPHAPVLLYLHGSRWNLSNNLFRIARMQRMGFSVLAIDYRGFGQSDGTMPSEEQAYADAQAAWEYLRKREPVAQRRFVFGHSLGGAVAIELATREKDISGLIVESTFTSIRDMAEALGYGYLPVGLVLTQRFDSLEKIGKVDVPLLIVHGTGDRYVPHAMSEKLFEAAREPKKLLLVPDASHSNVSGVAFDIYRDAVREFVRGTQARVAAEQRG